MQPTNRLLSLDVFRGMTIAGMILVKQPGMKPLYAAGSCRLEWPHPTDLVFPFFVFIARISLVLSLTKRLGSRRRPNNTDGASLKANAHYFGLGLLLTGFLIPFRFHSNPRSSSRIAHLLFLWRALFYLTKFPFKSARSLCFLFGYAG